MTTLTKTVGAQAPLVAAFEFTMADAMLNTSGVLTNFKATGSPVFSIASLPFASQITGGELVVRVVSNDSGTSTISVGDSGSAVRYLAATNLKALGRTPLVPTGLETTLEHVRITMANANGDATTGDFKVVVMFIVDGRVHENLKTV